MTKNDQTKILEILDKMKSCSAFHYSEMATIIKRLSDKYPEKKDWKLAAPRKSQNLK
jgi:hypothetical protein